MKQNISFTSASLQKINSEADSIISNHLQDLDRISNDIKALEERLRTAGIPFTFLYVLSSDKNWFKRAVHTTTSPYGDYVESSYVGEFVESTDNCLIWGKTEDGEHRLSYAVYTTEDEVEKYTSNEGKVYERVKNEGETKLFTSKPLIEMKSNFRLKIENELPGFYKLIVESIKTKRDQERIIEYSQNYNLKLSVARIDPNYNEIPF